jgi:hypothetical protein
MPKVANSLWASFYATRCLEGRGQVFLRIFSRKTKDDEVACYLALVHNELDSRSVHVTNVIHNFGREDILTRQALARLTDPGSGYRLQGCR